MIIDAHQHFWQYTPGDKAWITEDMQVIRRDFLPGDLDPILSENGIHGTVAVQVDQTEEENNFMLAMAEHHPFIKGIVGWVDLVAPDLEERLRYWKQFSRIKGFRHIVQGEPTGFLKKPGFITGVKKLAAHDFTYDLLIYHHQLPEAIPFLKHVEDVKIVIDHMAKPAISAGEINAWRKDIMAVASFDNVHCKVSGMVTEANWQKWKYDDFKPYLDMVLEGFGPGRLLYGSDWPVCLLAASYARQFSIVKTFLGELSDSEKQMVLGENAKRFYNL